MAKKRPEVSAFFSVLHSTFFKPRGYSKTRQTFQKEEDGYAVAFQFQGSDWNDAARPWRFYLNAGLRFSGIPRREMDRDFPTIHSWMRVGPSLSDRAEPHYEVLDDFRPLLIQIAAIVEDCHRYFSGRHDFLRQQFLARPVPYLGYLDEALLRG